MIYCVFITKGNQLKEESMMRKNLAGWLGMLLACVMIVTALPLTAWAETPSEQEEMTDPYMQVSFLKLLEGEKLVLSDEMESTTQTARDLNDGVMLNGPISELNAGRVTIAEPFVFDGEHNPVGRISLDAVADRNVFVTAKIYLDDDEEPVVEAELENRSKKDGWDLEGSITFDVYKKIETGEHTVSIGFDVTGKSSVQKTNILLRSIEFAENPGIPVMYFHIDEDQGSIEAMNNDTDHKTQCYGSVDIQVPDGYQSEYEESPSASLEGLELDYISAEATPHGRRTRSRTRLN